MTNISTSVAVPFAEATVRWPVDCGDLLGRSACCREPGLSARPCCAGWPTFGSFPTLVTSADVVAILGGGLEVRPFAAAEFYNKGLVTKVLVSEVPEAGIKQNRRHSKPQRAQPDGAPKAWCARRRNRNVWACE